MPDIKKKNQELTDSGTGDAQAAANAAAEASSSSNNSGNSGNSGGINVLFDAVKSVASTVGNAVSNFFSGNSSSSEKPTVSGGGSIATNTSAGKNYSSDSSVSVDTSSSRSSGSSYSGTTNPFASSSGIGGIHSSVPSNNTTPVTRSGRTYSGTGTKAQNPEKAQKKAAAQTAAEIAQQRGQSRTNKLKTYYTEENNWQTPKYKTSEDLNGTRSDSYDPADWQLAQAQGARNSTVDYMTGAERAAAAREANQRDYLSDADYRQMDINDSYSPNWKNDQTWQQRELGDKDINIPEWFKGVAGSVLNSVGGSFLSNAGIAYEAGNGTDSWRTQEAVAQMNDAYQQALRVAVEQMNSADPDSYSDQFDAAKRELLAYAATIGNGMAEQVESNLTSAINQMKADPHNDHLFEYLLNNGNSGTLPDTTTFQGAALATRDMAREMFGQSQGYTETAKAALGNTTFGNIFTDLAINLAEQGFDAAVGKLGSIGAIPEVAKKAYQALSLGSMALRVFGQTASQVREEGGSFGQQTFEAGLAAGVEVLTEKMSGGIAKFYGKGDTDEIVEEIARRATQSDLGRTVIRAIGGMAGEALEEVVSGITEPVVRAVHDAKATEKYVTPEGRQELAAETGYSALVAALAALVGGSSSYINGNDAQANAALAQTDQIQTNLEENGMSTKDAQKAAPSVQKYQSEGYEALSKSEQKTLTNPLIRSIYNIDIEMDEASDTLGKQAEGKRVKPAQVAAAEKTMSDRLTPEIFAEYKKFNDESQTKETVMAAADAFNNELFDAVEGDVILDQNNRPVGRVKTVNDYGITIQYNDGKTESAIFMGNNGLLDPKSNLAKIFNDGGGVVAQDDADIIIRNAEQERKAQIKAGEEMQDRGEKAQSQAAPQPPKADTPAPHKAPTPAKAQPTQQQTTQQQEAPQQEAPQQEQQQPNAPTDPQFQNQDVYDNNKYEVEQSANGYYVKQPDGGLVGPFETYEQAMGMVSQFSQQNPTPQTNESSETKEEPYSPPEYDDVPEQIDTRDFEKLNDNELWDYRQKLVDWLRLHGVADAGPEDPVAANVNATIDEINEELLRREGPTSEEKASGADKAETPTTESESQPEATPRSVSDMSYDELVSQISNLTKAIGEASDPAERNRLISERKDLMQERNTRPEAKAALKEKEEKFRAEQAEQQKAEQEEAAKKKAAHDEALEEYKKTLTGMSEKEQRQAVQLWEREYAFQNRTEDGRKKYLTDGYQNNKKTIESLQDGDIIYNAYGEPLWKVTVKNGVYSFQQLDNDGNSLSNFASAYNGHFENASGGAVEGLIGDLSDGVTTKPTTNSPVNDILSNQTVTENNGTPSKAEQYFADNPKKTTYQTTYKEAGVKIKKNADGTYTVSMASPKKNGQGWTKAVSAIGTVNSISEANQLVADEYSKKVGPKALTDSATGTPVESPQNASQSVSQEEGNSVLPNEQNASEVANDELNSKPEAETQQETTKAEEKPTNPLVEEKKEQPKTEAKVERTGKPITEFKGDYYFLHSTFKGGSPAKYDGKGYTSIQEAFNKIISEKKITNRDEQRAIMKELIKTKFTGVNADKLLKTGDSELISQYDLDGKPDVIKANDYGKLLMEVRDELRAERQGKQQEKQEKQKQKEEKPKPAPKANSPKAANVVLTESQQKTKEEREAARKKRNEEIKAEADAVNEFYYGSKKKAKEATSGKKPTSALFRIINEIAASKGVIRETNENGEYIEPFGKYINRIYRAFGLEADIDSEFHFMPSSKNNSAEYTNEEWIDTEGAEETDKITAILDQAYNTANQGNEDDGSMRSPRGSLSDSLSMADMPDHIQANIDSRQRRLDEFVESLRKQQAEGKELTQIQIETRARMLEGIEEQRHRLHLAQQWNKYSAIVDQIQVLQSISKNKAGLPVLLTSNGQVVNPTMEQFWGWIVNQERNSGRTNFKETLFNRALDADVEALLTAAMAKDGKYNGKTAYDLRLTDVLDLDVPNPLFEYDDAKRIEKDQADKVEIDATDEGELIELSAAINEIIARGENGTLGLKPQKSGVKYEAEETDPKMMTARQSESNGSLIATYDEVLGSVEDFEEYADTIRNIDDPMVRKVMDAIDYTLEVDEDGVHAYYDWQKLNAILSDPYGAMNGILNSKELTTEVGTNRRVNEEEQRLNFRDSTNHTVSNADVLELIDAVEFLLPQEGERRVDRNERGDLEINKIYGKVDTRTINQKNSEGMSDAAAKKLAKERNSGTVFGDPKRSNSKITTDLVDANTAFKWYMSKVRDGSYWAVKDAKAKGIPFDAKKFWEDDILPNALYDSKTGKYYFSFRSAINLLATQDAVNVAKQFTEEIQKENPEITEEYNQLTARKQEIEDWLEKYQRKHTNLLAKASNIKQWNAEVKQAQEYDKERQQIKKRLEEIEFGRESAKNLLNRINNYGLTVWEAATYYPLGAELFGNPKDGGSIASAFGRSTVKGLMNAETREHARELVDWLKNEKLEDKTRYEQGEFVGSGRYVEQFGNVEYYTPGNGTPGVTAGNLTGGGRSRNNTGNGESTSGQNGIEPPVSGTGTGERGGSVPALSSDVGTAGESGQGNRANSERTGSNPDLRPLRRYKDREERRSDWHGVKANSETLKTAISKAVATAKIAFPKGGKPFLNMAATALRQSGVDFDSYNGYIVAVQNRRSLADAAKQDKRFNTLGKRAAKLNADVVVYDASTRLYSNGKLDYAGGQCVSYFENGVLKSVIYGHNYDSCMHENEHVAFVNAAFNNFKGEAKNSNIAAAKAGISKAVDEQLKKSFEEIGVSGDVYQAILDGVKRTYGEDAAVEELYVELAARAFNGSRNGTFSTWSFQGMYLDEIAQLLKAGSATFDELVNAINNDAREYAKKTSGIDSSETHLSSMVEDVGNEDYFPEPGEGVSNEGPDSMDARDWEEFERTLGERDRERDTIALYQPIREERWVDKDGKEHVRRYTTEGLESDARHGGYASTARQREENQTLSEQNSNDEAMQEARMSAEANYRPSRETTANDKYGSAYEKVQTAQKRRNQNKRRSAYNIKELYYHVFGQTNETMRNYGNIQTLNNNIDALLDGRMSFRAFTDYALRNEKTGVVGTILNEDIRDELRKVAALEEQFDGKNPQEIHASKDGSSYQHKAANLAAHIAARMDMVEQTERQRVRLENSAKKHGAKGKKGIPGTLADKWNRYQITGDNFWRMMDNWEGKGQGYSYAKEHLRTIATRISEEAKLKGYFEGIDEKIKNSKEFKNFISGATKASVDFDGHKISLMEAIKFVKLVDTMAMYDSKNGRPDYQRASALNGFAFKDDKGNTFFVDIPGGYDTSDAKKINDRTQWVVEKTNALRQEIKNNKAANAYMEAVEEMYYEASKDAEKVHRKVNGYDRYMYGKGWYTDIHYTSKNSQNVDFSYNEREATDVHDTASMQERSKMAGGYAIVAPMSASVDAYISQISNYIAFEEFGQELGVLTDSNALGGSYANTVRNTYGNEYAELFDNYVKSMTLFKDHKPQGAVNAALAKSRQLMMSGALVASISVPMKQVSSFFDTMGTLDPRAVRRAFITNPLGLKQKGIKNYLMDSRNQSVSSPEFAELFGDTGIFGKVKNNPVVKLARNATSRMDATTVSNVYKAAMYDVEYNNPLGKGIYNNGKNFKDGLTPDGQFYVDAKFEEALLASQPIFTPQARNELARTDNQFARMFQTFRTQQTQNYNRALQALNEYQAAKRNGTDTKEKAKTLRDTVHGQLAASVSLAALTAIANAVMHKHHKYKDDDDEFSWEKFAKRFGLDALESFVGNGLFIGDLTKWVIDKANISDSTEFYGISAGALSTAWTIGTSAMDLYGKLQDEGWSQANKVAARYLAGNVATAMGMHANNVYNMLNAGWQWYADLAGIDRKYDDIFLQWAYVDDQPQNRLVNAILENDTDKITDMYNDMGQDKFQNAVYYGAFDKFKAGKIDKAEYVELLMNFAGKSYKEASSEVEKKSKLLESGISQYNGIDGRDGRKAFYDRYADSFKSRAEYKQFFADVKEGKEDGKHNTYYTTYNGQQQEVSANQSSIIDTMNRNIQAGNFTYDTAKLLWENYYGYSTSKYSAWKFVGK